MTVAELMNGLKNYLEKNPDCEDNEVLLCDGELMICTINPQTALVDEVCLGSPQEVCLG